MTNNLQELQDFLDQHEIPKSKKRPKTFLGIAKQPHYENVLSNMYAFFFRMKEVHGFKDLFIKSLLQLINESKLSKEKQSLQNFNSFSAVTEYSTDNGGRIDLLLINDDQAIIIENKVYHDIKRNDLDDYWNSTKIDSDDSNKLGIILSLNPVAESEYSKFEHKSQYLNVTHLEFLNRVQKNLGAYLLDANHKYQIFLTDLIQNVINMSTTILKPEEINFYFDNQEKINATANFKFNVRKHIKSEVEKANTMLGDFIFEKPRSGSFNDHRARYFVSPRHKNLMIVIVFADLLDESKKRQIHIAVELKGDLLRDREQYRSIEFTEKEKEIVFGEHFKTTKLNWSHFAVRHYILESKDITNLASFIVGKIESEELLSIFQKVDHYLTEKKNKG